MIGELIGGGLKLLSGFMNQNAQENANAMNQANWQTSMAYQDLVNKNQIQWKVEDAKKAGLHPLAALGSSTASGPVGFAGATAETGLGDALSGMGSDISRAINVSRTQREREQAYNNSVLALDVENKSLQNEILRSRLAQINQNPTAPFPGVKVDPAEDTARSVNAPTQQAGTIPTVDFEQTQTGYQPVPGKISKERQEDDFIASTLWKIKNMVSPALSESRFNPPAHVPLKEGHVWVWDPISFEYQQRPADHRKRGLNLGRFNIQWR